MALLRLLPLSLLLFLAACATGPAPVAELPWQLRSQQLAALENWTARGKIALRSGQQAESGNLNWQQRGSDTRLQLAGPMGLQATEIRSDGRELLVQRGDEVTRLDISTPDAVRLQTGWDLPLQALPFWLKGLPAPEPRATAVNIANDVLQQLEQNGWLVRYERYRQFGDYLLPIRLSIERGDTRARLIIQDWQPGPV
ncbi:MAG: lipoprotein insertase outer membrane protein LolB [Haliea sp.]|uniref:lipoprotein insertase outer membrane protein LolB n=1 Tax=Haliea sp. TaxID=1932666 RepID=UPI0032EC26A2